MHSLLNDHRTPWEKKHGLYFACRPIIFCMSSTLGIWTLKSSVPTLWLAPPSSFWECSSTWTRTGGYECLDHRRTKNRKILKGWPLFPILKLSDLKPDPIITVLVGDTRYLMVVCLTMFRQPTTSVRSLSGGDMPLRLASPRQHSCLQDSPPCFW